MHLGMIAASLVLGAVVYPQETDAPLHNPHKGWVVIDHAIPGEIDAGRSADRANDGTPFEWFAHAAVLSTWAQIEPEPGVYDWSLMDQSIDYWSSVGKPIHLRFATDDFGTIPGCPRWIFDMGVPRTERAHLQFPDYTHPVYRERLALFLEQMAAKYAEDPRIETINLQGYGEFGEWHSGANFDTVEQRVEALRGIIDAWRKAFGGRKLLNLSASYEWRTPWNSQGAMLPHGTSIYEEYRPSYHDFRHRSAFDYAYAFPDVTLSRHGCAGAVFQEYDGRMIANFFQHYRKPTFMEFFGGVRHYTSAAIVGFAATRDGDDHVENAVDELLTHHPTYATPLGWGAMGDAAEFYNDYRDVMIEGHKRMGYRFALVRAAYPDAATPGGSLILRQTWENRAMGRCRYQFPLAVYLMQDGEPVWTGLDAEFDQRYWTAGEIYDLESRFELPADLAPGRYRLAIAFVDDAGAPAIALAMDGDHEARIYELGEIAIDPAAEAEAPAARASITSTPTGCALSEALGADGAWLVSFAYTIERDPERDLDTDDPGYFRLVVDGADDSRILESRWFDKAGQPTARKTVLVRTLDAAPYRLAWEAVGGGAMRIEDVTVTPVPADAVRIIDPAGSDVARDETVQIREGDRAAFRRDRSQVTLPDDWADFLSTRPERTPLEPNTTYTVWFYWAAQPQIWHGDYAYLAVRDDDGATTAQFRWTQRHTANPVLHAYSFRTGDRPDQRLVWGVKNGGDCRVSKIRLLRR